MTGNRCTVRVCGDRVWALADHKTTTPFIEAADLVYHFVFDSATDPKHCQIFPEAKSLGITLTADWILNFDMSLLEEGHKEFPGSVVWLRTSFVFGTEAKSKEYALVQVINGKGERIEPAWGKFEEYQNSEASG